MLETAINPISVRASVKSQTCGGSARGFYEATWKNHAILRFLHRRNNMLVSYGIDLCAATQARRGFHRWA